MITTTCRIAWMPPAAPSVAPPRAVVGDGDVDDPGTDDGPGPVDADPVDGVVAVAVGVVDDGAAQAPTIAAAALRQNSVTSRMLHRMPVPLRSARSRRVSDR